MFEINIMNLKKNSFRISVSICLFGNFHSQLIAIKLNIHSHNFEILHISQNDGALVESITFNRRVVGSTPAVGLGQVLYLQLPLRFGVKLRYSIRAVVGS